jgi:EmrB/QacA subfamily drug resistance transporter
MANREAEKRAAVDERILVPPEAGMHGNAALLAMSGIVAVILLAALDQTIVGTALPRVVAELGGFALYGWVATSYLLTSTIMVPIMGKLGDLYGRKRFLLASVVIFVGASALAGAATSMMFLVIARGIQGIGAGMLQATAFATVSEMFPQPARRARWQGMITSTFAIASVVGPVMGGVLTEAWGWRSVFYINLPVGIVALVLLQTMLPGNLSVRSPKARIDWAGAATITVSITALLLAVEWGGIELSWSSPTILSLLATAGIALVIFGWVELHTEEPLFPVDLLQRRTILLTNVLSLLLGFVMFALVYYTPLLFQGGLGLSPSAAGAWQTPLAVSTALGSTISGQIFARVQRMKGLMYVGAVLLISGTVALLPVNLDTPPLVLSLSLAVAGMGVGFMMPMLTLLVQSIVERRRLGVATSTIQFLRLIGSTIGTAVVASAVNSVYAREVQLAVTGATDPRLMDAFHNPQALINPKAQAEIQGLVDQLGGAAASQAALLNEAAHRALVSGVRFGYVLALGLAVVIAILVVMLRTPNYRDDELPAPSQVEPVAEAF